MMYDMDDVISVAMLAMIKAIDQYDAEKGEIVDYVGSAIRNAVWRFERQEKAGGIGKGRAGEYRREGYTSMARVELHESMATENSIDDMVNKIDIQTVMNSLSDVDRRSLRAVMDGVKVVELARQNNVAPETESVRKRKAFRRFVEVYGDE